MLGLSALQLLVGIGLVLAVLSLVPPLPHWLTTAAVILVCVGLLVGR